MTFDLERGAVEFLGGGILVAHVDRHTLAGERESAGSNLWFRMTRLNSCAGATLATAKAASTTAVMNARITFPANGMR